MIKNWCWNSVIASKRISINSVFQSLKVPYFSKILYHPINFEHCISGVSKISSIVSPAVKVPPQTNYEHLLPLLPKVNYLSGDVSHFCAHGGLPFGDGWEEMG